MYTIRYDRSLPDKASGKPIRGQLLTAAFFLLFLFCIRSLGGEGLEVVRSVMLPEEGACIQALSEFVTNLQQGQDFGEAVAVFCAEAFG